MKYQPYKQTRNSLSTAITVALTAVVAMPVAAFAQQATPTDAQTPATQTATDLDKVTVTGYRYAIEKSLDQKRNANAIVEVVTAEDVGKFPDKNVADALQRVPGVIISRDGGEGKHVSVRGLSSDLTLTLLNGNYVASSESNDEASRSFNYTLLPSNMLSSAELFKTPEARLDEGGIGGTVILHTRRPLELESNSGFVNLEGTSSDTNSDVDSQLSAQYSWHSDDNRFGILVGVTDQKRTIRSMEVGTENYQWYGDDYDAHPATDVNGSALTSDDIAYWWGQSGHYDQNGRYYTNFFLPTAVNFGVREEERERKGGQLTFQFKPTDNLTLTADYFRFELQGDYTFNQLKIPEWNIARYSGDGNWPGGRLLNGYTFDKSGTIVTGAAFEKQAGKTYYCTGDDAEAAGLAGGGWGPDDCTIPTPQLTGGYSREKTLSQTANLALDWNISDLWKASFSGGRTWSDGGPSINFRMSAKPRRAVNGSYADPGSVGNSYSAWDVSGTPTATFSPNLQDQLMAGIAEIDLGSTDSSWMQTSNEQNHFQADFTKLFENSNWLDSIQFGVKYTDGEVHRNTGNTYWVCQGEDPSDYDSRYQTGCDETANVAQPGYFYSKPLGDIKGGFNANVFPGINFPAYIDHLNSSYGGMQTRIEPDFVYNVGEKVYAGYFQANFRTDRLRGNVGVRLVKTKQHAESTDSVEYFMDYFADGPDGNPLPCTTEPGCESGYMKAEVKEKTWLLNTLDKNYTDVLPSFNIAYDVTDDLVLRAAASKVIARSAYTDLASPGGLEYVSPEYTADRTYGGGAQPAGWYGSSSNKDLEPYEANQYDVSLEWYLQPGSVIGLGVFRKDVRNFVVPVRRDQQIVLGGETITVQGFSTSANGRDGVSQGVELYMQHTFDNGFGVQMNFTQNDTNLASVVLDGEVIGESPLIGSADSQANATVFYENAKFLARASYNWRGTVVGGLDNGMNVYSEPYDQLDLNVAYNITDNLTVTGSVLNATKSEQRAHLGNDTKDRFYSNNYSGRVMYLGLNYKF